MSVTAVYTWTLPWEVSQEEKDRCRRIFNRVTIACLILTLIIPFLPLPEKEKPIEEIDEKRLVKILIEKKIPPPPKVVKKVEPKKIVKPVVKKTQPKPVKKIVPKEPTKPKVAQKIEAPKKAVAPAVKQKSAKEVAAASGLLAFQNDLSDIHKNAKTSETLGEKSLSNSGGAASRVERSLVTKNSTGGSGGINTAALSRDVSGTGLGGRTASRVSGPAGLGGAAAGASDGTGDGLGRAAERDLEKIQITFDRNKSAIFSMYNRALRSSPDLQGKVVLNITIAPSGKVKEIYIVSSELTDTELESKLIQRVKLINFGAEDVPDFTFNYPIDFYPI
ncbi:MAG: TonB family protein [Pseudomonadota bacterium]